MPYDQIKDVLPHFRFEGRYHCAEELVSGNVNHTYLLEYRDGPRCLRYTLQHINTYVFKKPWDVMHNIALVTEHLRRRLASEGRDPKRRVLELVKTWDGLHLHEDASGSAWRAYLYISDAIALDSVDTLGKMQEIGRGFGAFQRLLSDFPAESLRVPIPDFHDTIKRFESFQRSVTEDRAARVGTAAEEIRFLVERRGMMGEIVQLLAKGALPLRVTHNDTKSNNVLIDTRTGEALCVIDLDTVMPGSSLYDYGDAIRFGASTSAEDEQDTSRVKIDLKKTEAFTRGFIDETNGFLSEEELRRLPLGIRVITCELAMRFLADYLNGDVYFKVNRPGHNLIRARAQMALLADVERHGTELEQMVQSLIGAGVHSGKGS